ncbi:hypothetical protein FKM82_000043 [Ascaphus truei]
MCPGSALRNQCMNDSKSLKTQREKINPFDAGGACNKDRPPPSPGSQGVKRRNDRKRLLIHSVAKRAVIESTERVNRRVLGRKRRVTW